jgi:GTP-binding protein
LGVVLVDDTDFVLADIPGLVEGAHEGIGLGHQFLRHVERTRLLIHLLDGATEDPLADFDQINQELRLFNPTLADKPQILVLNKHDLPMAHDRWPEVRARAEELGIESMFISAVTQHGVKDLMRLVVAKLETLPQAGPQVESQPPIFTLPEEETKFTVERQGNTYVVSGPAIDHLVDRTFWGLDEAVKRAQFTLERLGVLEELREAGVQPGDTVFLGEMEMEWMW